MEITGEGYATFLDAEGNEVMERKPCGVFDYDGGTGTFRTIDRPLRWTATEPVSLETFYVWQPDGRNIYQRTQLVLLLGDDISAEPDAIPVDPVG